MSEGTGKPNAPATESAASRWSRFETEGKRRPEPKGGVFTFLLLLLLLAPFAWLMFRLHPVYEILASNPRWAWLGAALVGIGMAVWTWGLWRAYRGGGSE